MSADEALGRLGDMVYDKSPASLVLQSLIIRTENWIMSSGGHRLRLLSRLPVTPVHSHSQTLDVLTRRTELLHIPARMTLYQHWITFSHHVNLSASPCQRQRQVNGKMLNRSAVLKMIERSLMSCREENPTLGLPVCSLQWIGSGWESKLQTLAALFLESRRNETTSFKQHYWQGCRYARKREEWAVAVEETKKRVNDQFIRHKTTPIRETPTLLIFWNQCAHVRRTKQQTCEWVS